MGTRGVYGFRKNGVDKITYNHYDSYPDCLGSSVLHFIAETSIDEMKEMFDGIEMVLEITKPTDEQIETHKRFANTRVSTGSLKDWYCLLHNTQGDLRCYKDGCKYMIDSANFLTDSLFCEYGYIINLDTEELEFWVGFQHEPDPTNRYGTGISHESSDGTKYYPCKLAKTYSLLEIQCELNMLWGNGDEDLIADMNSVNQD